VPVTELTRLIELPCSRSEIARADAECKCTRLIIKIQSSC